MRREFGIAFALLALAPATSFAQEWGKGVPYTTDFGKAIQEAQATGKMVLIYNGWENPGV